MTKNAEFNLKDIILNLNNPAMKLAQLIRAGKLVMAAFDQNNLITLKHVNSNLVITFNSCLFDSPQENIINEFFKLVRNNQLQIVCA